MLSCWDLRPQARPNFSDIVRLLETRMREVEQTSDPYTHDIYANVPDTLACFERANSGQASASAVARPPQSLALLSRHGDDGYPAAAATMTPLTLASLEQSLPSPGAVKTPVQDSADDYLTPSEHYYSQQQRADVTSQYLTSPSLEHPSETERLLSMNSNNEAVEHGDEV